MGGVIAAIDQGTTSTRCMLFDAAGGVAAVAQSEHKQIYPRPGWVEHDATEIWNRTCQVVGDAVASMPDESGPVVAVGITNQRETVVFWNRQTGEPYGNALVWQDTRTQDVCNRLGGSDGPDRFRRITGLPLATYFTGPRIVWAFENVTGLREDAQRGDALCGTIDSWLIWQLTGGVNGGRHVTDVTNASRTLLMNLETLDWDDGLLSAMDVPRSMLPRIVPSSDPETWGCTDAAGPFGRAIPVCGAVGDQQAALLGQCCYDEGDVKNTYGTGCFLLMSTGQSPVHSEHGLLTTVGYRIGDAPAVYALEGSIAIAGSLVQWLRDNLGLFADASDIERLAASVEDNGGAYIVPAFSGLFAPHWRSDARGVIAGLTGYVTKAHLARAALESTCYQTLEVVDAMRKDSGIELSSLRVDGGMVINDLLMQFQADILDTTVVRPRITETTALGAAYAAGLAVGFFPDLRSLRANWQADREWTPSMDASRRDELCRRWSMAVERTLGWE